MEYKDSLEGNESKEMDDLTEINRCNIGSKFEDDSIDSCYINKDTS